MVAELSPSSNEKRGDVLNNEEVVEARFCTSHVLDGSSVVLCFFIMCTKYYCILLYSIAKSIMLADSGPSFKLDAPKHWSSLYD